MVKEQLKLLINLARVDGEVVDQEKQYIINIGVANQVSEAEVLNLFTQKHEAVVPAGLSAEERFNCIFSLVQLMKIDERLYPEETKFCAHVAAKLGYDEMAMVELLLNVKAGMKADETQSLQELVKHYLK
jgi:uncharacterized tellurite resistance protein B-like protein